MTTSIPLVPLSSAARPFNPGATSAAALSKTLDRIAYMSLCGFVFTVPWGDGILFIGPLLLVNWFGVVAFVTVALRVMITGRIRKPSTLHYGMAAFALWSVFSVFWTVDRDTTLTRAGTYMQMLAAVWVIWELATTENRVLGLLQSYVLGAVVASTDALYNFALGRTTAMLSADAGMAEWDTQRYTIEGVNANDLGLILALSIPIAFYLLASPRSRIIRALCWLQLIAGFTAIVLTGSRGSMASVAVGLIIVPLTFSRLSRGNKFMLIAACSATLAAAVYLVPLSSWLRIFQFGDEISSGTLTHRTVLWTAGLDIFRDHPFFGIGSGAFGTALSSVVDGGYKTGNPANSVAHNTFISVLVELGVVGALLLLALLADLFVSAFRMPRFRQRLWLVLLFTWCVGVSALTWEYRKVTWILFALVVAHAFVRRPDRYVYVPARP